MISDILKERMILEMFVGTQLAPKILNALLLESVVMGSGGGCCKR